MSSDLPVGHSKGSVPVAAVFKGKIVTESDLDALLARVRAQVAEEIAQAVSRRADDHRDKARVAERDDQRESHVALGLGLSEAVAIAREHAVAPAESVVGAPSPVSAPSDVAAPRDALTDQDFDDFNETIADRDCSTLDSACHSVWLHGKWRWLTSQMTTEEKEAFADAVDRAGDWLVHLVRTAALMSEETECDEPNHEAGEDCDACAWDHLYQGVPQPVKAAAERAHLRRGAGEHSHG